MDLIVVARAPIYELVDAGGTVVAYAGEARAYTLRRMHGLELLPLVSSARRMRLLGAGRGRLYFSHGVPDSNDPNGAIDKIRGTILAIPVGGGAPELLHDEALILGAAADDGGLYVCVEEGRQASDESRARLLQLDAGAPRVLVDGTRRITGLALDERRVYLPAGDHVTAIDRASGAVETLAAPADARPVVGGGFLYSSTANGTPFRWPLAGGAPEWLAFDRQRTSMSWIGGAEPEDVTPFRFFALAAGHLVVTLSADDTVPAVAFPVDGGAMASAFQTPSDGAAAIVGDRLYFTAELQGSRYLARTAFPPGGPAETQHDAPRPRRLFSDTVGDVGFRVHALDDGRLRVQRYHEVESLGLGWWQLDEGAAEEMLATLPEAVRAQLAL